MTLPLPAFKPADGPSGAGYVNDQARGHFTRSKGTKLHLGTRLDNNPGMGVVNAETHGDDLLGVRNGAHRHRSKSRDHRLQD